MNLKFGWSRRSFLSALGAASGGLFAPAELSAAGMFGKKPKPSVPLCRRQPHRAHHKRPRFHRRHLRRAWSNASRSTSMAP